MCVCKWPKLKIETPACGLYLQRAYMIADQ